MDGNTGSTNRVQLFLRTHTQLVKAHGLEEVPSGVYLNILDVWAEKLA